MKKFALAAAAVAMPLGILASTSGAAFAGGGHGTAKVDASQDTIACSVGTGYAQLAPKVTTTPKAKVNSVVSLSLTNCTVSGPTAAAFTGVTVTGSGLGVLHANTTGVTGIPATLPTKGKITIQWSAPGVQLKTPFSQLSVGSLTVGTDGTSATVAISSTSVKGNFAGGDNGATSSLAAATTQTLADLGTAITTGNGLGHVDLTGSLNLG
jgi:hypothetical protein